MKSLRLTLYVLLIALNVAAFAETDALKPREPDAQMAFDELKSLAGTWQGKVTTTPPSPEVQGKCQR